MGGWPFQRDRPRKCIPIGCPMAVPWLQSQTFIMRRQDYGLKAILHQGIGQVGGTDSMGP
jgi:hypothetical protein